MNKKDTLKTIDEHLVHAITLAEKLVESEARKILAADPGLDEFVMAMGSCFFTYKDNSKYDMLRDGLTDEMADALPDEDNWWGRADKGIIHDTDFQSEFMELVDGLNDQLHIMGCPMRVKATGETIKDW